VSSDLWQHDMFDDARGTSVGQGMSMSDNGLHTSPNPLSRKGSGRGRGRGFSGSPGQDEGSVNPAGSRRMSPPRQRRAAGRAEAFHPESWQQDTFEDWNSAMMGRGRSLNRRPEQDQGSLLTGELRVGSPPKQRRGAGRGGTFNGSDGWPQDTFEDSHGVPRGRGKSFNRKLSHDQESMPSGDVRMGSPPTQRRGGGRAKGFRKGERVTNTILTHNTTTHCSFSA
jgi:hypothetical protein